jgi:hypothetical protein
MPKSPSKPDKLSATRTASTLLLPLAENREPPVQPKEFDLNGCIEEAKKKKSVPSYEELQAQKGPIFQRFLSNMRERLRPQRESGKQIFVVLGTGGTFQSKKGPEGYEPTGSLEESFAALQLPKDDTIHLELCDLMNLDSSQMTVQQWSFLAGMIVLLEERAGDMFDGIIITHGTDTMAKGSSYLSFMLPGFPKSIVFTGSQHPALEKGSDAKDQMEHAINASKIAAGVNRRITEIMVACGMRVVRAAWSAKRGDKTTNTFGNWNEPDQSFDSTDWLQAMRTGTLDKLTPALLDFGNGKTLGDLTYADHAITYERKGVYRPFTKVLEPASLFPTKLTDKSEEAFVTHLINQRVALLIQLGSATADDALIHLAMEAADHGKATIVEAPFYDSTVEPGTYKAGAEVGRMLTSIRRSLPILNTSPDAFEAKTAVTLAREGIQPIGNTKGLGIIYDPNDLRKFYDIMETNIVGELV